MMKKGLILLLGVVIMGFAAIAIGGVDNAGIQQTPHNIPTYYPTVAGAEPCAYCHTPHVPDAADDAGQLIYPLWNRSQQTYTYTMYTSPTHQMYDAGADETKTTTELDTSTRQCMYCHNGQVSVLINYPGRGVNLGSGDASKYNVSSAFFSASGNLGTNLKPDHPVAFTYNPGVDTENNGFPAITASGARNVITGTALPLYDTSAFTGQMLGCGTCHEPHDRFNYVGKSTGTTGTQVFFLRNSDGTEQWGAGTNYRGGNADSALCRACHVNRY
jgi:hypothetical protein